MLNQASAARIKIFLIPWNKTIQSSSEFQTISDQKHSKLLSITIQHNSFWVILHLQTLGESSSAVSRILWTAHDQNEYILLIDIAL